MEMQKPGEMLAVDFLVVSGKTVRCSALFPRHKKGDRSRPELNPSKRVKDPQFNDALVTFSRSDADADTADPYFGR